MKLTRWLPHALLLLIASLPAWPVIIGPLPVTLQNGTTADANQVMSDFNAIVNAVNANAAPLANAAQTNLSNVFTFPQTVPNATGAGHAVNAGQIQQQGVTYFNAGGSANAYTATAVPAWTSYQAGQTITLMMNAANTGASTLAVNALASKNILNTDLSVLQASAVVTSQVATFMYDGTEFQLVSHLTTGVTPPLGDSSTKLATSAFVSVALPPGTILDFGGSSLPIGFLAADGSAVSRTTYANLYAALGTTWGPGDGSTTFNLPNLNGRTTIGSGTGTVSEVSTTSSGNGWVVASNNTKWISGQPVVLSSLSGFTTSASAGPTYYVVKMSATNVRLATTLALAQALNPDVTVSGSGSVFITGTFTARTVGENGGEEAHAQNINELLAHTHPETGYNAGGAGTEVSIVANALSLNNNLNPTNSTGGNLAANVMQPFGVVRKIIKY